MCALLEKHYRYCMSDSWSRGRGFDSWAVLAAALSGSDLGQVVHTNVPLLPSSIVWFLARAFMSMRLCVAAILGSSEQGEYCSSGSAAILFVSMYRHVGGLLESMCNNNNIIIIIKWKIYAKQVRSSICAVNGRQTVMQKDSIEALHQYRDPFVQEACLCSFARVQRNLPFNFQGH